MAIQTRTADVDLDAWIAQVNGAGAYGNGKGIRLGIGQNNVDSPNLWQQRSCLRIPLGSAATVGSLFEGIPAADRISSFRLYLRVDNDCGGKGSAIRLFFERATGTFIETSYAVTCGLHTTGGSGGRWPGPARTTDDRGTYSGDPATGAWIFVDLTAMAQAAFTAGLTELVLVGLAANADLTDYDEETTNRRIRFYSRETTSKPYGQLQWNDNAAPNAPTEGTANGASTSGTQAAFTFKHNDPEGDGASKYQAQWGTVEDFSSGIAKDETITAAIAHGATRTHTFTGLPARTTGWARARTFDGQWGAWGPAVPASTLYKPSAANLTVEPGTLTPDLAASISSQDPSDYVTAARELIYQDQAGGGTITKWDSGKQTIGGTPTRSELPYGGTPLVFGQPYRRQMQLWNRDDVASDLTASQAFTQSEPSGGRIRIGAADGPLFTTATKIDDLTPDLYVSDPGGQDIDQARLRIWGELGETLLYDSGLVSFTAAASQPFTIPSGVLTPGMNPKADVAIRIDGNATLGPYSEKFTGHVNATPGSPSPVTVSGGQTVQRSDGTWVTTSATPTVRFPFRDTDKDLGYAESMTEQVVEIRTLDDSHFASSPYTDSTDPSEEWTAPTLTAETTYKTRATSEDTAGSVSAFSEYAFIKRSAAPTLTSVTPADSSTVTDPTPSVDGTYGHTGGIPEEARRLIVRQAETILHDSGWVEPGPIGIPAFTLPNDAEIELELTSRNVDGLTVTVTNTITTEFTTPDAITGLTVTQDDDEVALLIEWDPGLEEGEFEAYYVDARSGSEQFRRVATITSRASTALLYRGAGHNVETVVRVSQTNGWATSEPAETSATLEAVGYWLKRP
jgi:hypothetical protein